MKEIISEILKKALDEEKVDIEKEEIENLIEIPPNSDMGDYAFPCFFLSKKLKITPKDIALNLRQNIGNGPKEFEKIETAGPYINFFVDKKSLAEKTIKEIMKKGENLGKRKLKKKIKTMIEFPSPNTNKPLHLGHVRNMCIGESIARILEFNGEKVIRANLNNDRGVHICKSMAAYKEFGKGKKPDMKSDHFVGKFYVMFNEKAKKSKKFAEEPQKMLLKWEQGDGEILALWNKMRVWALEGFKETYEKIGLNHDVEFYESEIYKKGKEIIKEGLKKKIFKKKEDGAVFIDLKKEKLGKKIVLRSDGTSVYITQDIYLAKHKFEKYKIDKSIYVVGNEQDYHFKVLFEIMKKLGFENEMHHLSYGMVELIDGKMKSREGNVVDADNLIDEVQSLVKKELDKKKISKKELESRSLKIALAAIKYLILKIDVKKNMIFNEKESINFEGDTGSYILYSFARACSILKKIKKKISLKKLKNVDKAEFELIKKMADFESKVGDAYRNMNPAIIANYAYQLAKMFNEFYHACPVINSENELFRVRIVQCFTQVLKNALFLLGIERVEEM